MRPIFRSLPLHVVALLAFLLFAATGCGIFESDVPTEVVGACEGQSQIIEAQAQNEVDLINWYEAKLVEFADQHSKERLDTILASGTVKTSEDIKKLVLEFNENRDAYVAESAARKAKYLAVCASNAKSAKALNDATRKYLDSLGNERQRLKEVIDAIKPPATGAGQAATRPSPIIGS